MKNIICYYIVSYKKGWLLVEESEIYKKLSKDIKELEEELKDEKLKRIKVKTIRNLKITARIIQLLAPYVTTSLVLAGTFKYTNNTPILKDNETMYLTAYEEMDSKSKVDLDVNYELPRKENAKLIVITRTKRKIKKRKARTKRKIKKRKTRKKRKIKTRKIRKKRKIKTRKIRKSERRYLWDSRLN